MVLFENRVRISNYFCSPTAVCVLDTVSAHQAHLDGRGWPVCINQLWQVTPLVSAFPTYFSSTQQTPDTSRDTQRCDFAGWADVVSVGRAESVHLTFLPDPGSPLGSGRVLPAVPAPGEAPAPLRQPPQGSSRVPHHPFTAAGPHTDMLSAGKRGPGAGGGRGHLYSGHDPARPNAAPCERHLG